MSDMPSLLHRNTSTPQDLNYPDYSFKPSLIVPVTHHIRVALFDSLVVFFTIQCSLVQTIFTNRWLCFGTPYTMCGVEIKIWIHLILNRKHMCTFNSIEGNVWQLLKQMDKVLYRPLYMCVCMYTYIYIVRVLPGVCRLCVWALVYICRGKNSTINL